MTDDLPAAEGVALCLIDVDTFEATLSALRKVKPLLVPGGVVLLEDGEGQPLPNALLETKPHPEPEARPSNPTP